MECPFGSPELQEIYEGDTELFMERMEMTAGRVFQDREDIRSLVLQ
ncbi:hypothetical protein [Marispirochaeta sp.]|nr:hypothetical protein [Marispirochaeta sp.]